MKICVPTANDQGFAAPAYDHFGSAPFLTLVDLENDVVGPSCVAHGGEVIHPRIREALGMPPLPSLEPEPTPEAQEAPSSDTPSGA